MPRFENHEHVPAARKAEEHEKRRKAKRGEGSMPKHGKSVFTIQEIMRKRAEEIRKKKEGLP